jgi:signal transduction histidine kinase/integral membrane sensor domain MASE1
MSYRVEGGTAAALRRRYPHLAYALYPLLLAATTGLYIGAAKLGINLSVAHGVVTPVWAPAGIALAALVLFGPRLWPAVAIGALIANATSGASLTVAAFISIGNTLAAVAGAFLLRRAGFRPTLERVRDVVVLVLLAAVSSTAIAATNGVTTLWIADRLSGSYGSEWFLWWSGDAMGDLVVAPLLLVWLSVPFWKPRRSEVEEGAALLASLGAVSWFVFLHGYWRYPHLLFPLLVWASLRFRQRGAVTSGFVVAAFAIAGAVEGTTPLGGGTRTEVVQIAEGLLAAVIISLLILGAVLCERSAAEANLERERAALADAQELAHIGSWEWDVGDDRITCSEELCRIYGLKPVPHVDYASYLERIHPDDRALVRKTVEQALSDPAPFSFEHRVVRPDETVRWVHGRGRVVADAVGRPARLVGTSQDLTATRQLEQLRENILATVSHELRTPLTSILGFAITLKEHGASLLEATRDELLTHLVEQARRLDHLLSDMLDLDRLRHGLIVAEFRATDVGALVRQVAAERPAGGHPILVTAEPVVAEVDATKIEQIVENLLANAIKHTPGRTEVSVRVARVDDSVLVAVDDRGPGIAPHEREGLFELFSRGAAYNGVPGAGVGLSLVAQFAALHGGRAWVEENPGGGASFRVSLPLRQPSTRRRAAESARQLTQR